VTEPQEPEGPQVPLPDPPESEQVIDLDDSSVEAAGEQPEDTGAPAAGSPEEAAAEEADTLLEGADPDAGEGDESAAHETRVDGFLNLVTGSGARFYQAGEIKFFGGEASALPRHGQVPVRFLKRMEASFAAPPCHDEMVKALGGRSAVQCYVGAPGTGRTTAAIMAAVRHLRAAGVRAEGNVRVLSAERGLSAIDWKAVPGSSVLLLPLPPDAPGPDVAECGTIAEELSRRGSALIIVTDREPRGSASLRYDHLVDYRPPSLREVFGRHLLLQLERDRVREILSTPSVSREVERCGSPREAAALAAEVLGRVDGVPDDQLVTGWEPEALERARGELAANPVWRRAFLVAAAVLDGQPAETVIREAKRLADLHTTGADQNTVRSADRFAGPVKDWSENTETVGEAVGDGSGQRLRLVHPRLAGHLLDVFWREHLGERDAFLSWLHGLGDHPRPQVRAKAAQAVARLASHDHDHVLRETVRAWARGGGFRTRQTAAWSLEALAVVSDERTVRKVHGLVKGWIKSSNIQLVAAGVTAYGTFLGAQDPDETLARLREAAGGRIRRRGSSDRIEREIVTITQRALLDMFAAGAEEQVVRELAAWSRFPHGRRRLAAAQSLLQLARRVERGSGRPVLAVLALGQPALRDDLVLLWRNALHPGRGDERSWEALHHWIVLAENDPELADVVAAVIEGVQADNALARRLDYHRRLWKFRRARG